MFLVAVFAGLGLGLVVLRSSQMRSTAAMQRLWVEGVRLDRRIWMLETELATQFGPESVRKRIDELRVDVEPPFPADRLLDFDVVAER
jgi:hypothetical protein